MAKKEIFVKPYQELEIITAGAKMIFSEVFMFIDPDTGEQIKLHANQEIHHDTILARGGMTGGNITLEFPE